MSEVSIRPAVIEDAPALALLVAALRAHQKDPIGHLNEAAIRRDGFGDEREFDILVAERDRRPIGYALFTESYEPAFAARGPTSPTSMSARKRAAAAPAARSSRRLPLRPSGASAASYGGPRSPPMPRRTPSMPRSAPRPMKSGRMR